MGSRVPSIVGALSLVLPLACAGCGSGREATYPVAGTVRFEDGEPVRFGVVEFRSQASRPSARGKLNPAGKFTLGTFAPDDGAPAGNYQAVVVQHFNVPPRSLAARMPAEHEAHQGGSHADARVAPEYGDYATSPLRATVRPDSKNEFDFVVSRHPAPKRQAPSREN